VAVGDLRRPGEVAVALGAVGLVILMAIVLVLLVLFG